MSSGVSPVIHVKNVDDNGVALLSMDTKPVNSMSLEFMVEMTDILKGLEEDATVRAVVLTSGLPKIFCAGLDITEMYQPSERRLREFWRSLQNLFLTMYPYPKPLVAAITGAAPAGGCLMSLCADHRVMAEGPYVIGLNETMLGITAPFWFAQTLVNTVGQRQAERLLQLGSLEPSARAEAIGLVDETAPVEKVVERAIEVAQMYAAVAPRARHESKMILRQQLVSSLREHQEHDIDFTCAFLKSEDAQKRMGAYLATLSAAKKKK